MHLLVNAGRIGAGLVEVCAITDLIGQDNSIIRVVRSLRHGAADQRDPGVNVPEPVGFGKWIGAGFAASEFSHIGPGALSLVFHCVRRAGAAWRWPPFAELQTGI